MSLHYRYEFVLLFDVKDGNPNGDPDAGNLPRIDAETGMGLVTDVCLKRKIRNYIQMTQSDHANRKIFIKEKAILNDLIDESYLQEEVVKQEKTDKVEAAKKWMCANYYDVRCFGAVMSTGKNAGQVRGPVQLTFSRSINPVIASEHTITRMAVTTKQRSEDQDGSNQEMGRKFTIPYGLYRCHGFISAFLANQTGFDQDDLKLFWESLERMFDHDRSASRGEMTARGLFIFKHNSELGNAPAFELFDKLKIRLKESVEIARSPDDYRLEFNKNKIPEGVELTEKINYWQ